MRVAFVGPELEENLALRYLHASVEQAGHEAAIFDFHAAEQIPELAEGIRAWQPQVVGLSMVFTARAGEFIQLAQRLRGGVFLGHITAGGHFASFNAESLLADFPALDSVIHGEGEEAIVELVEHLGEPERVGGLTWRDGDGRIRSTARRPNLDDLDTRALPTRPETFQDYFGLPIANILSSRGCYGNCRFCSINAWHQANGGRRFRQRSPEWIAREMVQLYHDRGVRIFNFHDDNFFLPGRRQNLQRLAEVKRHLDEAGVGRIAIQVKARPDSVDSYVLRLLKGMGLFRVFLGVETDAVTGLAALGRGIERRQNHEALRLLKRFDVHTCFNLLVFAPDTPLDDLRANVRFMRQQSRFPLNFCRVEIYAGTDFERQLREEKRLLGNYLGHSYRIADPKVQLAYEIFRDVFTPRNFTAGGMNHQAMTIDYEFHLLRHFFPSKASSRLERTVKGLVCQLNANNAELMGEICRFVDRATLPPPGEVERFTAQVAEARERFDERIGREMHRTRVWMQELATTPAASGRGKLSKAASVAAVALMATTVHPGQAAQAPGTHMAERAPAPLDPPTHPLERVPVPVEPPEKPETPAEAASLAPQTVVKVRRVIDERYFALARQLAAAHGMAKQRVRVELRLDRQGKVAGHEVWTPGEEKNHAAFRAQLGQMAGQWKFSDVKSAGACTVTLNFALPRLSDDETAKVKDVVQKRAGLTAAAGAEQAKRFAAVYVELDDSGRVAARDVQLAADQPNRQPTRQFLEAVIGTLKVPDVKKAGYCTILIPIAPEGLQPIKPPQWHMFEMAPREMPEPIPEELKEPPKAEKR